MKVVIVDDEPQAIKLLEQYLDFFKGIELLGCFRNGLNALDFMRDHEVDLVLLDIDMPHINGISLAKILPKNTRVIFTTAHAQHAVESYELEACDYLLKPISLERFGKSLMKLMPSNNSQEKATKPGVQRVVLKEKGAYHFIDTSDILYLKKDGNQMLYFLKEQELNIRQSVAEAQELLGSTVLQIHKSILVNPLHVSKMDSDFVVLNEQHLSIGPSFKEAVQAYFLNNGQ